MFSERKPGEQCDSHICLMVAAAALAKPGVSCRPSPGREMDSLVGTWAFLYLGQWGWTS